MYLTTPGDDGRVCGTELMLAHETSSSLMIRLWLTIKQREAWTGCVLSFSCGIMRNNSKRGGLEDCLGLCLVLWCYKEVTSWVCPGRSGIRLEALLELSFWSLLFQIFHGLSSFTYLLPDTNKSIWNSSLKTKENPLQYTGINPNPRSWNATPAA